MHRRCAAILALITAASTSAHAQELRGTVRDSSSARPIPGAVILLLGTDGATLGRNITNERGEYRIALSPAITRARFLRLGFRPRELPIPAATTGVAHLDVSMVTIPQMLEAVKVNANTMCPRRSDEAAAFALLEQAHAALLASVVSRETNRASLVRYAYDRTHDGTSDKISRMTVQVDSAANTAASFAAVHSAKDFVRRGFMEERPGGEIFYAPDAEVLLDSAFSSAYCFQLRSDKKRANQVGLAFTAARTEKNRVDVDGTLWVDTSARALSKIEFVYKGIDPRVDRFKPGGTISFHEMPNGSVLIDRWSLRLIGAYVDTILAVDRGAINRPQERLNYYVHERGGELAHARWPDGTTWDGSLATLQATARTRNGLPAPHAQVWLPGTPYRAMTDGYGHIEIHDLVLGPYKAVIIDSTLLAIDLTIPSTLEFTADRATTIIMGFVVPTLDQYVVDRCMADDRYKYSPDDTTRVIARFFDARQTPVEKVRWQAWANSDRSSDPLHVTAEWVQVREHGLTGTDGMIELCTPALVRGGVIEIRGSHEAQGYAVRKRLASRVNVIPIPLDATTTVADLEMSKPPAHEQPTTAGLVGVVVQDSTEQPIPSAEVSFPELGKSVLSDAKGQFRIAGIPVGEQRLQVRRVGYGAAEAKITFAAGQTLFRRVVLGRAVTLEAVNVNAMGVSVLSFDEHKRIGLGHFLDSAEIAKFNGMQMTSMLSSIPGVQVVQGRAAGYVMGRRAMPPRAACTSPDCLRSAGYYVADRGEYGIPIGCYSLVYVDGLLMNGQREPTEPFDVNTVAPDRVAAIEYYAGPSETPPEYSRMGTKCGVLVIWTTLKKK